MIDAENCSEEFDIIIELRFAKLGNTDVKKKSAEPLSGIRLTSLYPGIKSVHFNS